MIEPINPEKFLKVWNAPRAPALSDAQAVLAERKLYWFLRYCWPIIEPANPFIDSFHIGSICEHLEALYNKEILRLIINVPRRRAKSTLCSVAWFCWCWIKNPHLRFQYMSYGQDLSLRDSVKCRDIILSPWFQAHWPMKLKDDQNAKGKFDNDKQGYRLATSTGGKVVGFGADINCADDPHDYKTSWSPKTLEDDSKVWINGVHRSVNDPRTARFLVVMQRLQENDLSGLLIREEHGYEHLCLPEEYEKSRVFWSLDLAKKSRVRDPIVMTKIQRERPIIQISDDVTINVRDPRQEDGDLLSPERYPKEVVEREKRVNAWEFASQNQQRPHPLEGTIIKDSMFKYFRQENREGRPTFVLQVSDDKVRYYPISLCVWFQTIDTALKDKEENDRTACCTWALTPGAELLLYDCFAARISVPYQMATLEHLNRGRCRWLPESNSVIDLDPWQGPLLFQAIEDAASGTGLILEGRARGNPFKALKADQNPMVRMAPLASDYASGLIYHLEGGEWVSDYEEEALGFPHAAHDDRIVSAMYGSFLKRHDIILKQHLNRDLIVSDREAVMDAEEIRRKRDDIDGPVKVKLRGGGVMVVDFDD